MGQAVPWVTPIEGAALLTHVECAQFVMGVVGGLEVGGAILQAIAPEVVGGNAPNAACGGFGEVLEDQDVVREAVAEDGSA